MNTSENPRLGAAVAGWSDAGGVTSRMDAELVAQLCALEQAGRRYDLNNPVVRRVLADLTATVGRFVQVAGVAPSVRVMGDSMFVNRRLVRMGFSDYGKIRQVAALFTNNGIDEMRFDPHVTAESLAEFALRLFEVFNDPANQATLFARAHGGVTLTSRASDDKSTQPGDRRLYALRSHYALLSLVNAMVHGIQSGQPMPLARIKRTVQVIVDLFDEHERLFLALAVNCSYRTSLPTHLVNTGIYSLAIGRRLGFGRHDLWALFVGALFHDTPKVGLPAPALDAVEAHHAMTDEDRGKVEQRWLRMLKRLLDLDGFTVDALARLTAVYESQFEFSLRDLYPQGSVSSPQSSFSMVYAVASAFDTLLWYREGKPMISPHRAMLALLEQAGRSLSPTACGKLFAALGLYPVGTLVVLGSGESAIVVGSGADPEHPQVKVVAAPNGAVQDGGVRALGTTPPDQILWALNASSYQVNPLCYLAAH